MNKLATLPDYIFDTFTPEEQAAVELLAKQPEEIEVYYQYEDPTKFDCLGYIGPNGTIEKYGDLERYTALCILENRIRKELEGGALCNRIMESNGKT